MSEPKECTCWRCTVRRQRVHIKETMMTLSLPDLQTAMKNALNERFRLIDEKQELQDRVSHLTTMVEAAKRREEVLMNMARYTTAPPPVLVTPQSNDLADYERFVQEMTLKQVSEMKDHLRGLSAEVGELNGKVYKADRDKDGELDKQGMLLELGDVLFYLVGMIKTLGFTLKEVIVANRAKLTARKLNGTLQGNGDKR